MTKLENQNFGNSTTQIVTELKFAIFDKTQKLKLGQNSKIKILTKRKNSNNDKTLKLKL